MMRIVLVLGILMLLTPPAGAEELRPNISYGDDNLPPSNQVKALVFTRWERQPGRKKYRINQYELFDGTRFTTTKKIKVVSVCPLHESHPRLYKILQVVGFIGPSAANGLGSGVGTAVGGK